MKETLLTGGAVMAALVVFAVVGHVVSCFLCWAFRMFKWWRRCGRCRVVDLDRPEQLWWVISPMSAYVTRGRPFTWTAEDRHVWIVIHRWMPDAKAELDPYLEDAAKLWNRRYGR